MQREARASEPLVAFPTLHGVTLAAPPRPLSANAKGRTGRAHGDAGCEERGWRRRRRCGATNLYPPPAPGRHTADATHLIVAPPVALATLLPSINAAARSTAVAAWTLEAVGTGCGR